MVVVGEISFDFVSEIAFFNDHEYTFFIRINSNNKRKSNEGTTIGFYKQKKKI